MNYYERHIGDYLKDTAHLSLLEHGIYGRLLDIYYSREAALPADQVMRLVGARTDEERSAVRDVLTEFFVVDGDVLRHSRCDRELARYQEKSRKAAASANARWEKTPAHTEGNANAMRTHSEGNAPSNQEPVTSNQTPEEKQRERASRLPADWVLPVEWEQWARTERPELDPTTTACKFRDYWAGIGGPKGRKLDWLATWRNWVREERGQTQQARGQHSETSYARQMREKYEQISPGLAARRPGTNPNNIIDMEATNGTAARLG